MSLILVPLYLEIEKDSHPDLKFVPESNERCEFYSKLAKMARKKVLWTNLAMLMVLITLISPYFASETIYHCFKADNSQPLKYTEIEIMTCVNANQGQTVKRVFVISDIFKEDLVVTRIILTLVFAGFYWLSIGPIVHTSIKLLGFGVKVQISAAYAFVYSLLGMLLGSLLGPTLVKNPTKIPNISNQDLYYWGSKNYPETFLEETISLLKILGVYGGLLKILLTSIKDPLDLFCSISNIIKVNSKSYNLAPVKYKTDIRFFLWNNLSRRDWRGEEDMRYQQILTALDNENLLLPYEKSEEPKTDVIKSLMEFLGCMSLGYEKEIRALVRKGQLSAEERTQLLQASINLIFSLYTKRWIQLLILSFWFLSLEGFAIPPGVKFTFFTMEWTTLIFWMRSLGTASFLLMHLGFEEVQAIYWCCCYFSFSYISSLFVIIQMTKYINGDLGNHYLLTPYICIAMCLIQIIAGYKIWVVMRLVRKAKEILRNEPTEESSDLNAPLKDDMVI